VAFLISTHSHIHNRDAAKLIIRNLRERLKRGLHGGQLRQERRLDTIIDYEQLQQLYTATP
jgi:hypothetical protein